MDRRAGFQPRCFKIVAGLLLAANLPAGAQLPTRTIDANAETIYTGRPAATFDADGRLLVSYYQRIDRDLRLAEIVPCGSINTRAVRSEGDAGRLSCVLVDSLGFTSLFYWATGDGLNTGLRYTLLGGDLYGDATVWIETAAGAPLSNLVAVLDSLDKPYVAARFGTSALLLMRFDLASGRWGPMSLDAISMISASPSRGGFDLTVNSRDELVLAYLTLDSRIVAGTLTGGGWTWRSHAIATPSTTSDIAVVCDSTDAPIVAYATSSEIRIARFHQLGVDDQLVATAGGAMFGPHSLAIRPGNQLYLAWRESAGANRVLVSDNAFGWHTTIVAESSPAPTGHHPALALDATGRWAIAFVDTQYALYVAGPGAGIHAPADFDCDGDVDSADLGSLRACLSGAAVPYATGCESRDLDGDDDIDLSDHGLFQRCLSGDSVPADPDCLD